MEDHMWTEEKDSCFVKLYLKYLPFSSVVSFQGGITCLPSQETPAP